MLGWHRCLLVLSVAVVTLFTADGVHAQQRRVGKGRSPHELRVGGGLGLGAGGSVDYDVGRVTVDDDLRATVGPVLYLEKDIHRYVSLGGVTRLLWWESDNQTGRNFVWDLALLPRVHYDLRKGRIHMGLPVGFSLSVPNNDTSLNAGAGANVGVEFGGEYWLKTQLALTATIGWSGHFLNGRNDATDNKVNMRLSQAQMFFGLVYGLR